MMITPNINNTNTTGTTTKHKPIAMSFRITSPKILKKANSVAITKNSINKIVNNIIASNL